MNIEEIKQFIIWCRKNKVKSFSHEGVTFELSEVAFVEELYNQPEIPDISDKIKPENSAKTWGDLEDMDQKEYDELLNWSANK